MPFHTDRTRRERILVIGPPKCHKTRSYGDIIQCVLNTNSEARFYILDTDYRAPQSLEHIDNWEKICTLYQPQTWDELIQDTDAINIEGERDDWLAVDLIGQPWTYCINYYIEQVMGKKPHQFFLDFKKGGGKGNPMAGAYGENWNVINQMYRDWIVRQVLRFKGHVLACAAIEPIEENDDKTVRKLFGPYGIKPKGQKELGYQFDSILLTSFGKTSDIYLLTSIGDTNREKLTDIPLNDFSLEYLVKVAGWKLI